MSQKSLRDQIAAAIAAGKQVRCQIEERTRQEKEEADVKEREKAQKLIDGMMKLICRAAGNGKSCLVVLRMTAVHYCIPPHQRHDICDPGWLRGAARWVYAACVEAGYTPEIKYWRSDGGEEDGFDLIIHWE